MPRTTPPSSEWTTFGRDLLVSVHGTARGQWATTLADQLREADRGGALASGVRLPSSRALAHDLGVSRGTVVSVYEQLTAEGYLESRRGSGTRRGRVIPPPQAAPASAATLPGPSQPGPARHRPVPAPRVAARLPRRARDAARRGPALRPSPGLRTAAAGAGGLPRSRARRPCRRDDILIVNGFAQGFALLARILPALGVEAIAVEEPGSTGAREQLREWGVATPPVASTTRASTSTSSSARGPRRCW